MRGIEYHRMPRIVHRDNKRYVNQGRKWNDTIGITVRVPSLKRSKKTWKNFYDLFPYIKSFLMSNGSREFLFGQRVIRVTLKDNVYTVVDERIHGPRNKKNCGELIKEELIKRGAEVVPSRYNYENPDNVFYVVCGVVHQTFRLDLMGYRIAIHWKEVKIEGNL